jgi:hypothetical protein
VLPDTLSKRTAHGHVRLCCKGLPLGPLRCCGGVADAIVYGLWSRYRPGFPPGYYPGQAPPVHMPPMPMVRPGMPMPLPPTARPPMGMQPFYGAILSVALLPVSLPHGAVSLLEPGLVT